MKTSTRLQVVSLTLMLAISGSASAEGFFSNLFSSKSAGSNFKEMLSHVPADTSYLFTNQKPFPKEVMSFHIKRTQGFFKLISNAGKDKKGDAKKKTAGTFISAFFDEVGAYYEKGKLEETGLSLEANYLIYGVDMMPVIRLGIANKEKLMAAIKRAEASSGHTLTLSKCGDFDCFVDESAKNDMNLALVFLKNQLVASAFQADKKDQLMAHLTGKIAPKEAYKADTWDSFLKENKYTGYGDGFINLKRLFAKGKTLILEETMKSKEDVANCLAVADDHLNNVPEIIFGTTGLTPEKMDYEFVLKTSESVSSVLQGIANKTNITKRSENAILDFGININFIKLREALTQYSNFLIKLGETHKCEKIKAKDIRKGMGGMMMAMNMGLTQFKSLYIAVNDIDLDKKMQPKNADAYISIGADDPGGLLGMISMMSPALMGFQVPEDGSVVKLPEGAIPSKGIKLPTISLSRTAKTLNILVGNDKPALKDYSSKTPQMMILGVDGKRYYDKLATIMSGLKKGGENDKAVADIMGSMGGMMGNLQEEISADKRGLVINYHVQYEPIK